MVKRLLNVFEPRFTPTLLLEEDKTTKFLEERNIRSSSETWNLKKAIYFLMSQQYRGEIGNMQKTKGELKNCDAAVTVEKIRRVHLLKIRQSPNQSPELE